MDSIGSGQCSILEVSDHHDRLRDRRRGAVKSHQSIHAVIVRYPDVIFFFSALQASSYAHTIPAEKLIQGYITIDYFNMRFSAVLVALSGLLCTVVAQSQDLSALPDCAVWHSPSAGYA